MKTTKKQADTAKKKPPNAGKGRPPGASNKINREVKEMILDALTAAGGVTYLTVQAKKNPKAFLSLLGRIMPLQVTGEGGGPLVAIIKDYTGRKKQDAAD